jgi:hypothetical protein
MPELMLSAYFDASTQKVDPEHAVMFVSGCVATDKKWNRFERQWLELLTREGIDRPFRMSRFWVDFRERREDRTRIARQAIQIIKQNTRKSFVSGVMLKPHANLRKQRILPPLIEHPYTLCGSKAIAHIGEWVKRRNIVGQIDFVFEEGDLGQGALAGAMREATTVQVRFQSKRDVSPFDAADLISWLISRSYYRMLTGQRNDVQEFLLELARKVPGQEEWGIHDEAWFAEHSGRWPLRTPAA